MATRRYRLMGMGYGDSPVNIIAKLDGTVVYEGAVPTDQASAPNLPDSLINLGDEMFRWSTDLTFDGTWNLEITVTDPIDSQKLLIVTVRQADCVLKGHQDDPNRLIRGMFFNGFEDTHTDEAITDIHVDGVPTNAHGTRQWPGQPYTTLRPQQTMTAVVDARVRILADEN